MRLLLGLGIILGSVLLPSKSVLAEEVSGMVVNMIEPEKQGDSTLYLMSSGRALRIAPESQDVQEDLLRAMNSGTPLQMEVTDLGSIDIVDSMVEAPADDFDLTEAPLEALSNEELAAANDPSNVISRSNPERSMPTIKSMSASEIFSFFRSKRLRRNSQCFWRAYYWAWSLHTQRGVSSEKVFLFFTPKYMRNFNYGWWFHVSPYIDSSEGELVLDATYSSGPKNMRSWTNQFMRNDAHCPTIAKYYGHRAHNQDGYCFLRKTSMYYFHPSRIQRADRNGTSISGWNSRDLATSRRALP